MKDNIVKKAFWWLYKKPKWKKSGIGLVAEMILSLCVGGLAGWAIIFAATGNPLYLLFVAPVCFHLFMIGMSLRRLNREHKEREKEFFKEHGMDMMTYIKNAGVEIEALKKKVEASLDELVRRGLIKEEFDKDGKQCWYIPDDKVKDVEAFLKELDEKEKGV
jgi:hypothetical protein